MDDNDLIKTYFVDVLLPLPVATLFTYRVPKELESSVSFGKRVIVPFGRSKLYTALVIRVHTDTPKTVAKYVLDVMDPRPIISERQLSLWKWIADYYMCTLGEVMACALPSALKLASETKIKLRPDFNGDLTILNEYELMIVEALAHREAMTVDEVTKLVQVQKILPVIKSLVEKKVILTDEEIRNPYMPKKETYIRLADEYASEPPFMALLDALSASSKTAQQSDALLAFMMQAREGNVYNFRAAIPKSQLMKVEAVTPARWQTLLKKGYLITEERVVSRLVDCSSEDKVSNILLSPAQQRAFDDIKAQFDDHTVTLLYGVTGSGKTEIYIKLIAEALQKGQQVLYLLPEIALTSQIVNRLRKYFGEKVGVYHSRFNEYERVEIWSRVLQDQGFDTSKYQLILGARSALLLPYQNLGLIIVDEEHDASYKQQDPAPRYHARDSAIMLGNIHKSKVLLGTATPSLESFYNVEQGKYGLVTLMERFADSKLPDIWTVNMSEAHKQHKVHGVFSDFLIEKMSEALDRKEQIILFQNRRGYAVRMICHTCETMPTCKYCDVTLTYHKNTNLLKCHYCGYAIEVPHECPTCHSTDISMKGFGTEKIEEALAELFPDARVARMDLDTTRSKNAYQRIITDFEQHRTDILVGTQMVTKGLDFDRVSVVGILNADALLSFPDFRAFERAFQLLAQVSGRAGRKGLDGKVIIQTYQPKHPALQYVETNDFRAMYDSQIQERRDFHFPPVVRVIKLSLKHPEDKVVKDAANYLAGLLRTEFPRRVLGPEYPLVARIQNYFIQDFWIKLPKDNHLAEYKQKLQAIIDTFRQEKAYKKVRCVINVDA
ncbi:MAG: primosomal protein N' [Bacteroidales bacterium]|nr:primosomal protein N' [Bacteroidales bacterium]